MYDFTNPPFSVILVAFREIIRPFSWRNWCFPPKWKTDFCLHIPDVSKSSRYCSDKQTYDCREELFTFEQRRFDTGSAVLELVVRPIGRLLRMYKKKLRMYLPRKWKVRILPDENNPGKHLGEKREEIRAPEGIIIQIIIKLISIIWYTRKF